MKAWTHSDVALALGFEQLGETPEYIALHLERHPESVRHKLAEIKAMLNGDVFPEPKPAAKAVKRKYVPRKYSVNPLLVRQAVTPPSDVTAQLLGDPDLGRFNTASKEI